MDYQFDPEKARENLRKHSVGFDEAIAVFRDPYAVSFEDSDAQGEHRTVTLGASMTGRLLVVVWTLRRDEVRIISARRATRTERVSYESQL